MLSVSHPLLEYPKHDRTSMVMVVQDLIRGQFQTVLDRTIMVMLVQQYLLPEQYQRFCSKNLIPVADQCSEETMILMA